MATLATSALRGKIPKSLLSPTTSRKICKKSAIWIISQNVNQIFVFFIVVFYTTIFIVDTKKKIKAFSLSKRTISSACRLYGRTIELSANYVRFNANEIASSAAAHVDLAVLLQIVSLAGNVG